MAVSRVGFEGDIMRYQVGLLVVAAGLVTASCTATAPTADAMNPNVPGATGRTVVIGSHSSMAGSNRVHPDWSDAATSVYLAK
jgi:hypothetical protein